MVLRDSKSSSNLGRQGKCVGGFSVCRGFESNLGQERESANIVSDTAGTSSCHQKRSGATQREAWSRADPSHHK